MANCILAFPDYVMADPTFAVVAFSGGGWTSELPLANLLRPELAYVARSIDCTLQSTQCWVDLGVTRDVRGVFVPGTNGSRDCQYRVRAFDTMDSGSTARADTGWQDLYPAVYPPLTLYWGHPSLWDGKLSAEDAAIFPMPLVEVFDAAIIARYWLVEFADTGNPAGYFQLARIVLSGGWQPAINMQWNASLVVNDPSVVQQALGGATYFDPRPKQRVQQFTLAYLADAEAMAWINDMQRRLGVSGQLFFVHDPSDRVNMHRRSFLARMQTLSPLQYAAYGNASAPFQLAEIVA